jgi:hypothetical protein
MSTRILVLVGAVAMFGTACGSGSSNNTPDAGNDPTKVRFGDTVLVVVLNPTVNDANTVTVPAPGTARAGVTLTTDDGVTTTTGTSGIAVLGPLSPGSRVVTLAGSGLTGTFSVMVADGELREIAVAAAGAQADIMVEIDYKSGAITEVSPTMSNSEVNQALEVSDTVVFFQGGTYEGDLDFSGSRVTLFGAGVLGGEVILNGHVTISGSDSRIRGTQITGSLTVPASGVGLSFSQVDGATQSVGSDATFLANALCGGVSLTGSGTIVLGNAGASPLVTCP